MPASDAIVTVRDVWHLALPAGTTVIAGSQALDTKVDWVTALRAAFPLFGSLSSGYLAIARPSLARSLDPRLTTAYLISELHRVRASALVVDEAINAEDTQLAESYALPILLLPPDSDLHEIERTVLRTIIDREGQSARREAEIRRGLLSAFERAGLQGLLAESASICGGQWRLCETNRECIAVGGVEAELPHETQHPVVVAGRSHGLLLVRWANDEADIIRQLTIRQTIEICSIALVELTARREAEERFSTELVEQVLDNNADETTLAARLAKLGLDPQLHYVLAIAFGTASEADIALCADTVRRLITLSRQEAVQSLVTHYRHHTLILLSAAQRIPERWLRRWLLQGCDGGGSRLTVGVGRQLEGFKGLRTSIHQALDAWQLGQRLPASGNQFYYEELGLYRLLAGLYDKDEMQRFYRETVGELVEYDRLHHTELVHTLSVFFEQNTNASQAARALYVHRNTLNYRLQRIIDITGLNLEDPEARLAFQIALKIHLLAL